jgi:hypothetical protein
MQPFCVGLPSGTQHAAVGEESSGTLLDEGERGRAPAIEHVGVFDNGQQAEQRMHASSADVGALGERPPQGRQRDLEHGWEARTGFAARTACSEATRRQLSM